MVGLVLVALLSLSTSASAFGFLNPHRLLSKRALPANSDGFVIPLSTDAQGRYVASIGMGNQGKGAPIQNFTFMISTSTSLTAVAGTKCPSCISQIGTSSLYNASMSQTQVALNGSNTITIGGNAIKGDRISEACGLKTENGSLWWYQDQTGKSIFTPLVVADESNGIFGNGASGLLGLGRRAGNDSFIETVFRNYRGWQNFTIGLQLNNPNEVDPNGTVKSAGVMDFRATDTQYNDQITYNPVVVASNDDIPSNYPNAWSLKLDSWSATADGWTVGRNTGGVAVVETSITDIRFPYEEAEAFYSRLGGATATNSSDGTTWSIPCKNSLSLTVVFGGKSYTVPSDKLVEGDTSGTMCTGLVRSWDNPFITSYLLGRTFAQTVYIVYNANRNGTDTIGFAPRGSSTLRDSRMSAGAVAGISVGATLAVVAALVIAFLWWRRKKRMHKVSRESKDGQKLIEPYEPIPTATTPGFTINTSSANTTRRSNNYFIEQGPIGGDADAHHQGALLAGISPEGTPHTANSSHRRKAEEAGYAMQNLSLRSPRRASSLRTHTTTTDFVQHLPPPTTPGGTSSTGPSSDTRPFSMDGHTSHYPSSPQPSSDAVISRHGSSIDASAAAAAAAAGGTGIRHFSSSSTVDPRHQSAMTGLLSPTSTSPQHQIHYHIHLPPGATPPTLPPGSIVHEYANDEPAPEYTERPESAHSLVPTTTPAVTTPHTATSGHFVS
ncbi:hypothetical protein PIIN_07589 [Serendipita indica DSM 11827]|uniref:Peptidase A1 domain-containing protein n=1 Tax=Serendipita indica (strain DSM 11827) TaxID=1109443 RepID=G4TQN7_SERID|nr:hypothetical protein PIIN_07589 [Serendipita indica DSM 11827]